MGTLEDVPRTSSSALLFSPLVRAYSHSQPYGNWIPNSSSTCLIVLKFIIYFAVFNCVATYYVVVYQSCPFLHLGFCLTWIGILDAVAQSVEAQDSFTADSLLNTYAYCYVCVGVL